MTDDYRVLLSFIKRDACNTVSEWTETQNFYFFVLDLVEYHDFGYKAQNHAPHSLL